mmetsp:Transcript_6551/g.10523  ORF Transcript_6551/g.10523 Transcript_6551/m.10523 type:complete len:104 (-) Transcript_6551:3-314(-)
MSICHFKAAACARSEPHTHKFTDARGSMGTSRKPHLKPTLEGVILQTPLCAKDSITPKKTCQTKACIKKNMQRGSIMTNQLQLKSHEVILVRTHLANSHKEAT